MASFKLVGDGYQAIEASLGLQFDVSRLRRDRGELVGELAVSCGIVGARTVDGLLSIGNFNLSSTRARQERARYLAERSQTDSIDWLGLLEELCQHVLAAERAGRPAVRLRDMDRPAPVDALTVDGLRLLRHHPVILFGDGGTAKSYLALYCSGTLARQDIGVLYADWELAGEDHRDRLERLFGPDMPERVFYARCERPMSAEVDRLARLRVKHDCTYLVADSVAFGCDGPPEAAEVAGRYMQCVRQIGVGSLLIAHTNRGDHADQKPFGSTFWHNGARQTYHVKQAADSPPGTTTIGVYPRKANLGPLGPARGFRLHFGNDQTTIQRIDLAEAEDLAAGLPLWQRIRATVLHQPRKLHEIADELDAKVETIERTVRRYGKVFTRVAGRDDGVARIALVTREVA